MKKKLICLLAACFLLAAGAYAASGENSLVSLTYLKETFFGQVEDRVDRASDRSDEVILGESNHGEAGL